MKNQFEKCEQEFADLSFPICRSNEAEFVKNKAALWSALTLVAKVSDVQVSKHFKYDRTTILHHRNKHEENMKYVNGYSDAFAYASSVVRRNICNPQILNEASLIDAKIRQLEQIKSSLINQLES